MMMSERLYLVVGGSGGGGVTQLASLLGCLLLLFLASSPNSQRAANALDNGLALRPPMGWLNWERFTCEIDCERNPQNCVSSALFESMADRLVEDGYRRVGYQYVNVDDCWSELERDSTSQQLQPNRTRFPQGIQGLASYIHSRGLRMGLYGDCGYKTCGGYPGQLKEHARDYGDNYFQLDAQSLANWQVDSFKFDGCYIDPIEAESICPRMALALKAATTSTASRSGGQRRQRPIMLSCEWPFYMMYAHAKPNFTLAAESCNLWRYYDDIEDSWLSVLNTIDYTVKHQSTIVKYHGPGHWFDPDQLVIGNFGLSPGQARAQMALWSVWSAPLYMSNDLRNIDPQSAALLKNEHLIEVDQDRLGVFGLMVQESADGQLQAFVKPVEPVRNNCPSFAIVYLNRRTLGNRAKMSFQLRTLLLGAPIRQAAEHQAELSGGWLRDSARLHSQLADDDDGEGLLAARTTAQNQEPADQGAGSSSAAIDAAKCLKRLAKAMGANASDNTAALTSEQRRRQRPGRVVAYSMFDLIEAKDLGSIALNEPLELLVDPSSVRAIRLEEMTE